MNDLRILSHGKITDLSKGFKMQNGETFSIMVVAKNASSVVTTALCTCRCVCDKEASPFPVNVGDWTPAKIQEISANGISLSDFDVFWGAGETAKKA